MLIEDEENDDEPAPDEGWSSWGLSVRASSLALVSLEFWRTHSSMPMLTQGIPNDTALAALATETSWMRFLDAEGKFKFPSPSKMPSPGSVDPWANSPPLSC